MAEVRTAKEMGLGVGERRDFVLRDLPLGLEMVWGEAAEYLLTDVAGGARG